jgi:hypothetical protein
MFLLKKIEVKKALENLIDLKLIEGLDVSKIVFIHIR